MLNTHKYIIHIAALASILLISCKAIAAGNVSVCINNKITLPGENGPEIWSCIGSGYSSVVHTTKLTSTENNADTDTDFSGPDTATFSLEKRSDASSVGLKNEISRVLEQTRIGDKNTIPKQISMGMQYSANRRDKGLRDNRGRSFILPVGMRFQLTDNTSVSATVPVIHKESESVSSNGVYNTEAAGVGDFSINATTSIVSESNSRPSVSISAGVGIPTGKIEDPQTSRKLSLGSGFWTSSLGVTISKRFDPATIFASTRYQHVIGDKQFGYDVQPGSSFEYSYGLGFSINSSLSVSGHIAGSIHRNASVNGEVIAGSNSEPLEFASTSLLRLNSSTNLESNLAFGLNKDAGDARFGLTLTREF